MMSIILFPSLLIGIVLVVAWSSLPLFASTILQFLYFAFILTFVIKWVHSIATQSLRSWIR